MKKPLQVFVEEEDLDRLDEWTRARGWTKADAIRAAIRSLTQSTHDDPLLSASGMIQGLPRDCSTQLERYLEESFRAKTLVRRRGRRARKALRR